MTNLTEFYGRVILLGSPIQDIEIKVFKSEDELKAFHDGLNMGFGWDDYYSTENLKDALSHLADVRSDFTKKEILSHFKDLNKLMETSK